MADHLSRGEAERQARQIAQRLGMTLHTTDTRPTGYALVNRRGLVELEWPEVNECLADLRHLKAEGCRA